MAETEAYWAYGIVAGSWSPPRSLRGVDGSPVELVRHDDVAVLASPVPTVAFSAAVLERRLEDIEDLAELARAHDAVLHSALATTDVAPLRICTLYANREAVADSLRANGDQFRSVLARLRDTTEWGVKGFRAAPTPDAPTRPPASGAEYLARRRAQRAAQEAGTTIAETAAAEVHEALSARAAASSLAPPQDPRLSGRATEMILNGAYLVARVEAESFAALVEEQERRHAGDGLELELTGPWPPYNFVSEAS